MNSLSSQYTCRTRPLRSDSRDSNHSLSSRPSSGSRGSGRRAPASATRMPPVLGQLSPDKRQRVYEEVLNSNRPFLCRHLDPSRHYSYLRSMRFFDGTTVEIINHNVTTEAKVNKFIDELIKGGPKCISAFMESLERNRVEQNVFSRLADDFQTFNIEGLDMPTDQGRPDDHAHDQAALHDENETFSSDFRSMSLEERIEGAEAENADTVPVFPPIDILRLREAQGFNLPESGREAEEMSDLSSVDGLVSHST